jgi:hypothetical protein
VLGSILWWRKSQSLTDQIQVLNLELLKRQLKPISPEDFKSKLSEIDKEESELSGERLTERVYTKLRNDVSDIENKLEGKLTECFSDTHTILSNRQFGPVILDLILLARKPEYSDYLIELKHIRKGFKYGWLRDNALKQLIASDLYQRDTNRYPIPILFIMSRRELLKITPTGEYNKRLHDDYLIGKSKLKVSFVAYEDIDSIECTNLRNLIF